MAKKSARSEGLLSLRATVVLLLAVLTGVAGGLLLAAAGRPLPEAVIGGFVAAAGSLSLFSEIVGE